MKIITAFSYVILVPLENNFLMICHPELVSGSLRLYQGILKQVQGDSERK